MASEKPDPPLNCGGKSHQVLPFLFMFLSGIVYCLLSEHNICEPAVEKATKEKKIIFNGFFLSERLKYGRVNN